MLLGPKLFSRVGDDDARWELRPSLQPISFASGRRVERDAALMASPISMVDQIAMSVVASAHQ